ncbi:acyl-CoA synthetase [Haematobacter genomosp. 1]|uniref:Acyl-CoA synthetase n=1 Tax=Haematobacter genomosp. 1 TaxID=366618 RepID=A0A212ACH3_9RHOB|nr:acyl-CoA synthetase [Haematobacter genomosp. 1]OWJ78455.1 acyl-CoA synthetase [Haematobacter genomosp. 1]
MGAYATIADRNALEAEMPWSARDVPATIHQLLERTAARYGDSPAIGFQLSSGPQDPAETLTWREFRDEVNRAANLFRKLGVGENDVVAFILPNALETGVTLVAGMVAGIVSPVNPLLDAEHMAGLLRETKAKVVVTLKSIPKSDISQKVAEAVAAAPSVQAVVEVDLLRYLPAPKRWIAPFLRPKAGRRHQARIVDFTKAVAQESATLSFADPGQDRVAAYFHTGGTTGLPKVAQHRYSGMIYNGWLGATLLFKNTDVLMCPLPLFHVFAAYPIFMSTLSSGAQIVLPTPAGYRGEGVFDNLWKLIERWKGTYLVIVPTAISALMQRPVDANISTLRGCFSGSAPLPQELFKRFEAATGVQIVEGYGLTECTCLVSVNPPDGVKKIGSVGLPFPYTEVRILHADDHGNITRECATEEVGEICVSNPGVFEGSTYTEPGRNLGLYADRRYLRTGDLGRLDRDGYLWITGRKKDLIIRGGHNIDPAEIEEALAGHPAVAFVGAIGQPDAFAGELPAAYVELIQGADVTQAELLDYARAHIHERAAVPKFIGILDELPKTAVGKVFKPDLRRLAITRVLDAALAEAGMSARVAEVVEDRRRGLVARLHRTGEVQEPAVAEVLSTFTVPWEWEDRRPLPVPTPVA